MWTFLIRRLLTVPALLLGVSLVTFALLRLSPGDFFRQMEMDQNRSMTEVMAQKVQAGLYKRVPRSEVVALGEFEAQGSKWRFSADEIYRDGAPVEPREAALALRRFQVGLRTYQGDEDGNIFRKIGPIEGYAHWLWRALHLDFGESYAMRRPVWGLITERMTNTLILNLAALLLAWGLAIPLGVIAAVRPNSIADHASGFLAFFGLSIPSVFFALLMVLLASYTGWFPVGDMKDVVHWDSYSIGEKVGDVLHHLILPAIVIGTGAMAGYMRQARGSMIETLSQDYIRTARAKGLPKNTVLYKHALRNAINPLVTLFGYSLAYLLSGSFLVEVVMNWPGLARLIVNAIFAKDEPVVMAAVLMGSVLLVFGNLAADILLALVDPRVRLS